MEENVKRRLRRGQLESIVLGTIATAGMIGVALIAPNVLGALAKLGLLPRPRQKEIIAATRKKLIKNGYAIFVKNHLRLTTAGEARLRELLIRTGNAPIEKPRHWDGKWRVLIFDIAEKRRSLRTKVRNTLEALGFRRLQDSVWVYPYPCDDLITLLKADFRIGRELLYLVVDTIEHDKRLKEEFNI